MQKKTLIAYLGLGLCTSASLASSHSVMTEIADIGNGDSVGTMTFIDTQYGLQVKPDLKRLTPGVHAVHVHENPDCSDAGDHFDPAKTGKHEGPYGDGHLGDLPNITVEADGSATIEVLAPRVMVKDLRGRAVIIHKGADRYDMHAEHSHGKGGARMYCGVIR